MRRKRVDLVILVLVLVVGFFAVRNARAIGDWAHSHTYSPPTEIKELADGAGMNSQGSALFYRFEPQIVDSNVLSGKCDVDKLGCAEGAHIYILQAATGAEQNRNIVTAAHEMLHVAWSRLSYKETLDLEPLLDAELQKPRNDKVVKALHDYPREDYYNEAHSFIGSQAGDLSSALEAHYGHYFVDRKKSIEAYQNSPER